MPGKKAIIGALFAVALAYVVYPYVALYRLGQAIRQGDATSLETMVNWSAVREGIKEDICDQVIDRPSDAKAGGQLPPFGAGFVRGIAGNAVDTRVTPQALAAVAAQDPAERPSADSRGAGKLGASLPARQHSWWTVNAPGQTSAIRLQMDLRYGVWRVTRVWLPPELLTQANART